MRKSEELYLVINLGLKSIRAIVFNKAGEVIFSQYSPIVTILNGEFVEQEASQWWRKAEELLTVIAGNKSIIPHIKGITVTSSSSCLVPIDHDNREIYNAIMVSDKRSEAEAKSIKQLRSFQVLSKNLGMEISAYHMLPKILWLKRHKPEEYLKTKYFLSPNDYLNYKLTGKVITDTFNAQKFHYDTKKGQYPLNLLKAIGIDPEKMPRVEEPGFAIGFIKPELVQKFNFNKDVKIILSTYDAICAYFGSGPHGEGVACDVSGTVTSLRTGTNKKLRKNIENIFCSFLKGHGLNIVGASNNLGGGLIEWGKQAFYSKENNRYLLMEKEAAESGVGARGLVFLPYLLGERAPIWDPDVRGMFFGIERVHTRKDFIRSVFESTAFITNDLVREIEHHGIKIHTIRVSGGLSRINLISQIKADVTGKRVELLSEPETTSIGALSFLLLGMGVYRDLKSIVSTFSKVSVVFEPNRKNYENYQKIFHLYQKIYRSSKGLFKIRKKIVDGLYWNLNNSIENL